MKTINVTYLTVGADGLEGETCMNIRAEDENAEILIEIGRDQGQRREREKWTMWNNLKESLRCAERMKGRRMSDSPGSIRGVELANEANERLLL
jgi:hypothetical protein